MVSEYVPVAGAYKIIHGPPKPSPDPSKQMLAFLDRHKNNPHGMVVTNTYNSTEPTIYLTDLKSVNEFIAKENECYRRKRLLTSEKHANYFFFDNGDKALENRAQFS